MIKGERIYLRLIRRSDINILYNICDDYNVNRYNTMLPDKNYLINNFYIIERIPNKILSIVNEKRVIIGFVDYRSYSDSVYTIGITIGTRFWGRGYGKESISVLSNYIFRELMAKEIVIEVIDKNIRAIMCYKACGFKIKERVVGDDGTTIVKMNLINTDK